MNNENEIERMAKTIELIKLQALNTVGSLNKGYGMFYAEHLVSAGYGDKKQAVKEFAEKFRVLLDQGIEHYRERKNRFADIALQEAKGVLRNLITELYGADER